MTEKPKDKYLERVMKRYVIAPFLVIVGMWIVGIIIDGALETNNTFTIIFISAGGIGMIGYYYRKFWRHGEETRNDE